MNRHRLRYIVRLTTQKRDQSERLGSESTKLHSPPPLAALTFAPDGIVAPLVNRKLDAGWWHAHVFEPDHYEAGLGQTKIQAVVVPRDKFRARLTWAELHQMQVLRCEEDAPRVAYLQLAPGLAFITLSVDSGPLPMWRGTEMQAATSCSTAAASGCINSCPDPSSGT